MTIAQFPMLLLLPVLCVGSGVEKQQPSVFSVYPVKQRFSKSEQIVLSFEIRNSSNKDALISDSIAIPYQVSLKLLDANGEDVPFQGVAPSLGPSRRFQLLRAKTAVKGTMPVPTSCRVEPSAGGFCFSKLGKYTGIATYIGSSPGFTGTCDCIAFPGRLRSASFDFWVE